MKAAFGQQQRADGAHDMVLRASEDTSARILMLPLHAVRAMLAVAKDLR